MPAKPEMRTARRASATAKARIFLVDDHPLLRKGIADCINEEPCLIVCGEAGTASEAMAKIAKDDPDVVVVDISMPGRGGLELVKELKTRFARIKTLVLSMHGEMLYAERALEAGAHGYVMKSAPTEEFLEALKRVRAGELVVGSQVAQRILSRKTRDGGFSELTPLHRLTGREMEVFRLLGEGRRTKEIAAELKLKPKTVEVYRSHIRHKLRLHHDTELTHHAILFMRDQASGL